WSATSCSRSSASARSAAAIARWWPSTPARSPPPSAGESRSRPNHLSTCSTSTVSDDDPEEEEVRELRNEAFFERMGVAKSNYAAGVLAPSLAFARAAAADTPGHRWRPYGARNIGGRVRAIAQDPTDARVLYAGSASGGLHRTVDAGDTWEPVGGP